jgi:hypothetical protein
MQKQQSSSIIKVILSAILFLSLAGYNGLSSASAKSDELQLTSGITHLPGIKSFKTIVDRDQLPESARDFTKITVQSSHAPFYVTHIGIEEFVGRPDTYDAMGYNSSVSSGGTFYTLTILYDANRNPLGFMEETVNVLSEAAPQQPAPSKGGTSYGSDVNPDFDAAPESSFTDIGSNYWASGAIEALSARKVISGYPDGKYRPEKIVTRAEFAKIMTLAAGLTAKKTAKVSFADIDAEDWHAPYIEAAKGYLSGYRLPNGSMIFDPNAPALREDIAVAIVKLKGYNKTRLADLSVIEAMFTDYDSISDYAKDYVALAVENKLISGFPDDTFRAQKPITRAEAAAILFRAYQYGSDNKEGQEFEPVVTDVPEEQQQPVKVDLPVEEVVAEPEAKPETDPAAEPVIEEQQEPEKAIEEQQQQDTIEPQGQDGQAGQAGAGSVE